MERPKVMVALRDVESVEGLAQLGAHLANGIKATLLLVHVVQVPPALPLDADAEALDKPGKQVLSAARQAASTWVGAAIETRLVRAREAGPALIDEAQSSGASLLVMGYHGAHGLSEVILGSTVQFVARHAPCRVIVQIQPVHHA